MRPQEPLLPVQISQSLYQRLASYQIEHQLMSISEAAIAILTAHFEPIPYSEPYAPLQRVIELEQQVSQLTEHVKQLHQRPPYSAMSQAPATPPLHLPANDLTDDEIEDEPDEILYDFLQTDP